MLAKAARWWRSAGRSVPMFLQGRDFMLGGDLFRALRPVVFILAAVFAGQGAVAQQAGAPPTPVGIIITAPKDLPITNELPGPHRADAHRRGASARLRHPAGAGVHAGQHRQAGRRALPDRPRAVPGAGRQRQGDPAAGQGGPVPGQAECRAAEGAARPQRVERRSNWRRRSPPWPRPMPTSPPRRPASPAPSSICNIPRCAPRSPAASAGR